MRASVGGPRRPSGDRDNTSFEIGDETITAMERNQQGGGQQDFPYEDVDAFVDDIMESL